MITANNYFEEIKPILSQLPPDAKEAHDMMVDIKNEGIEDPFNTGEKDIDEVGELLLKKANEILSSSKPKSRDKIDFVVNKKKTKAEPKASKKAFNYKFKQGDKVKYKNAKIEARIIEPIAHPKDGLLEAYSIKFDDGLLQNAYADDLVLVKNKPAAKKAAKKAPAKKAASKSPALKKAAQKTKRKEAKKTAKLIKQVVKNVRKADKAKPAVTKTIFSKELELIKQFISINGKTIKRQTLQTKRNAIANALKEGKVTMHIAHLKNILSRYNKVLSNLASDTTEVRGNIEKGFLTTLKNVVASAKIKVRTDVLGGTEKDDIEKVFEKYRYTGISSFAYDYADFMYSQDELSDWFQDEWDEDGEIIDEELGEFEKIRIVAEALDMNEFDKAFRDSDEPTLEFFENVFEGGEFQGYELTDFLEHIGLSGLNGIENDKITCSNCGWSWDKNQTTKSEMYKCHHCGYDSSLKK